MGELGVTAIERDGSPVRLSSAVLDLVHGSTQSGTLTIEGEAVVSGTVRVSEVVVAAARRRRDAARREAAQLEASRYVRIPGVRRRLK